MQPTLRPNIQLARVYLYCDPIDFRKSHRGLSTLIEAELGHNPFSGEFYAFTNKQRNKIKCVFWEDNGFVLYYKALAEDKFKWLKRPDELVTLTGQQLNWLLDGYDINLMKPLKNCNSSQFFSDSNNFFDSISPVKIRR